MTSAPFTIESPALDNLAHAPLGAGALIARKDAFREEAPLLRGGGSVSHVSLESETWNNTPDRDEAGSPNVVGVAAFGAAASAPSHTWSTCSA